MGNHNQEKDKILLVELQSYENQGISIWLEGEGSNSQEVSETLAVREENCYMRDYIFSEGKVSEIHFDRITKK